MIGVSGPAGLLLAWCGELAHQKDCTTLGHLSSALASTQTKKWRYHLQMGSPVPRAGLGLVDVLKILGFDATLQTKVVRHQDRRYSVAEMRRNNWLELYQSYQGKPRFRAAKQIVSFYGLAGTRAGFYGVYRVLAERPHSPATGPLLEACAESSQWNRDSRFFYELERDPRFDDLRDRLIVDWGPGTLAWVQNLDNKPVLQILESGRALPPFGDYLDFSLSHAQLTDLFKREGAHRDWCVSLSAVAGVYLIVAEDSGDLYVGSASGVEGIWGRWRSYAETCHGGNERLKALIESNPSYPTGFRFSVLQTLPRTMAREEVVRRETAFKHKLGKRATALNGN